LRLLFDYLLNVVDKNLYTIDKTQNNFWRRRCLIQPRSQPTPLSPTANRNFWFMVRLYGRGL